MRNRVESRRGCHQNPLVAAEKEVDGEETGVLLAIENHDGAFAVTTPSD